MDAMVAEYSLTANISHLWSTDKKTMQDKVLGMSALQLKCQFLDAAELTENCTDCIEFECGTVAQFEMCLIYHRSCKCIMNNTR